MKKRFFLFLPLLGMLLGGCSGGINPVTGISLDKTELSIMETESYSLSVTIEPKKATNQIIKWETSNPNIATVSTGGVVTGVSTGTADVKVITEDGGYTATCAVTVTPYVPVITHVTNIALSKQSIKLEPSASETVTYTVFPEDASEKGVTISSSNEEVVTVEDLGNNQFKINAVNEGKAAVYVTSKDIPEDGKPVIDGSVAVDVYKEDDPSVIHVSSVGLSSPSASMLQNEDVDVTYTVYPSDATDKSVTVTNSDDSVASISHEPSTNTISIHSIKKGTTTITVTANDKPHGKVIKSSIVVNVHDPIPVSGVSVSPKEMTLYADKGETKAIVATVLPADATNKGVTWSSSNPTVAQYIDGEVVALKNGKAVITATTDDGGFTDSCNVTVESTPTKRAYIDFEKVQFKENAYIDAYSDGKGGTGWPGTHLDLSNKIDGTSIILSDRFVLNRNIYYWDVDAVYDKAIFTNCVDSEVKDRWNGFDLSSYNTFQPTDWGVGPDDETTISNYNSFDLHFYTVTLIKADTTAFTQYNIPEWSSNGYTAPANTTGYKWVNEDGKDFVNGTNLTGNIVLHEVEIPESDKCVVKFYLENKTELYETVTVTKGSAAIPTKGNPKKAMQGVTGYDFTKWVDPNTKADMTSALANVQSDLEVEAEFASHKVSGRYIVGSFATPSWSEETAVYMTVFKSDPTEYNGTVHLNAGDELKIVYHNGSDWQGDTWCGFNLLTPHAEDYSDFQAGDNDNIKCKTAGTYTFYFTDGNYDGIYKISVAKAS